MEEINRLHTGRAVYGGSAVITITGSCSTELAALTKGKSKALGSVIVLVPA